MSPRARGLVRSLVGGGLAVGLIGWIVHGMVREAGQYDWSSLQIQPLPIGVASVVLVVTYLFRAHLWTLSVWWMHESIRTVDGMRVFMGSQLGRYVPGKLWQIAGAGVLARQYGVRGTVAGLASLLSVLLHHVVGAVLALSVIGHVTERVWLGGAAALVVGIGGIAFVMSPAMGWSLRVLARLTKRQSLATLRPPAPARLLGLTLGFGVVWTAFGATLILVATGLFPDRPLLAPLDAIGIIAAAAVVGFAVLVAPSGLGVREAVMVALLKDTTGFMEASIIAIGMRVVMTVTELALMLWGAWPWLRNRPGNEVETLAPADDAAMSD